MQMHVDLCWFMIPLSSLMWPKEYLNMCHIFYNNVFCYFSSACLETPTKNLPNQLTKDTGMRLPQRWASSYNRIACLYIIPTKILSISMTVAMLGKFYQYKDNKGTNWKLYGNMQVMLNLGEGVFQCLLWIALVIKQWLTDDVTDIILVWKLFLCAFLSMLKRNTRKLIIKYMTHINITNASIE